MAKVSFEIKLISCILLFFALLIYGISSFGSWPSERAKNELNVSVETLQIKAKTRTSHWQFRNAVKYVFLTDNVLFLFSFDPAHELRLEENKKYKITYNTTRLSSEVAGYSSNSNCVYGANRILAYKENGNVYRRIIKVEEVDEVEKI